MKADILMSKNHETIEKFLNNFVESIRITDSAFEKAEARYKSIGNWLNREESELVKFEPEIYSQGSIRLNIAIKPLNDDEDYDLDAVCLLNKLAVNKITQEELKRIVGKELLLYVKENGFVKPLYEGKRCWTLQYSDSAQFHMDILPSVPDEEGFRKKLFENNISLDEVNILHTSSAISITDNTSLNYKYIHSDWNKSNPKGYHEWFKEKSKVTQLIKSFNSLLASNESIEEIPNQDKILPLQKAIMILKRHRDLMFKDDNEHKPISIIITTLSAKAYKGTSNLKETLDDIVYGMEKEIDCRKNCIVLNPINPNENFADKWQTEPIKKESFFKWLEQLKKDYVYISSNNYENTKSLLESSFGKNAIQKTYNDSFGVFKNLTIKAKELLSLSHVQKSKWENNLQYRVDVICTKSKDGWMPRELKNGEAIEKNWNLRFEAKIQDVGSGRKFYWQVANSGWEATNANCLRGNFYEGEISRGGKVREESTSYSGAHFVRCFVIQHNQCVAISEPFIVNII